MIKWPYVFVLSLATGVALGWSLRGVDREPNAVATPVAAALEVAYANGQSATAPFDQAQLRLVVRDEMTAVMSKFGVTASPAPATAATPAGTTSPPTQQPMAQRHEALEEIDTLLAGGSWTGDERRAFHQKLALLDPEQARAAMEKLGAAITSGSIQFKREVGAE